MYMSEEKKNDEIVINLDTLAVPMAIIIAGVIIALSIYFVSRGDSKDDGDVSGSNTNTTDNSNSNDDTVTTSIDDDPYLGDKATAKVAIVEFSDYQCPYCQRHAQNTLPSIVENYVDTGKIIYVYRDFPISSHGQITFDSAEASECVYEVAGIDTFAKYHEEIFLIEDGDELSSIAKELGVNMSKYNSCMSSGKYTDEYEKDLEDGQNAGISGTPGFVVGVLDENGNVTGEVIAGAYGYETFKSTIEKMLAK